MTFKLFSVICLLIALDLVFGEELIECNDKTKEQMDRYMMELGTFGDPNGKYPNNHDQLAEQCKNEKEMSKWCTAYVDKCLKGISQELMSMSLKDLDKTLNKYCESPRLSKLFISWSQCGNSAINQTVKCWQDYVIDLEKLSMEKERIPNEDKTPLICCHYNNLDNCVEEAFISKGEEICPQQAVAGLHSLLHEIAGKTINIFCGDYAADNDKCEAIHKKYKHLKDIKIEKPVNKSPLNPFVDIVDNAGIILNMKTADKDKENQ